MQYLIPGKWEKPCSKERVMYRKTCQNKELPGIGLYFAGRLNPKNRWVKAAARWQFGTQWSLRENSDSTNNGCDWEGLAWRKDCSETVIAMTFLAANLIRHLWNTKIFLIFRFRIILFMKREPVIMPFLQNVAWSLPVQQTLTNAKKLYSFNTWTKNVQSYVLK